MLYVLHRNAMFSTMSLRPLQIADDEKPLRAFLKMILLGYLYVDQVIEAMRNDTADNVRTFVITATQQIVGICMVELSLQTYYT